MESIDGCTLACQPLELFLIGSPISDHVILIILNQQGALYGDPVLCFADEKISVGDIVWPDSFHISAEQSMPPGLGVSLLNI